MLLPFGVATQFLVSLHGIGVTTRSAFWALQHSPCCRGRPGLAAQCCALRHGARRLQQRIPALATVLAVPAIVRAVCAHCALDPPATMCSVVQCLGSSLGHCSRVNVRKKKITPWIWGITIMRKESQHSSSSSGKKQRTSAP